MIRVYINNVDRTEDVERKSIKVSDQISNRKNTLSLKVVGDVVSEGQDIVVWHGSGITTATLIGATTFIVDDIFEDSEKYRVGDKITVGIGTAQEENMFIDSINFATKTITTTDTAIFAHTVGEMIGKRLFAGIIVSRPDGDIGTAQGAGYIDFDVQAEDYSTLMDRKVVNESFPNMYPREVIGRILYEFVANDSEVTLNDWNYAIDTSDTTQNAVATVGDVSGTLKSRAKRFTAGFANCVAVQLYKDKTVGSPSSTLKVALQADSAGSPSNTDLASYTVSAQDFAFITSTSTITFPLDYQLTPATNYWIVVTTTDDGTDVGYSLSYNSAGTNGKYRDNAGAWNADTGALSFKVLYTTATFGGVVDKIEAGIAQGGIDDRIEGNNAIKLSLSGAGTGYIERIVTPVVDASTQTHVRLWHYIGDTDNITDIEVRIGNDSSNYFYWNITELGKLVWHYQDFAFADALSVGSPSKTTLDYSRLTWTTVGAVGLGNIAVDIIQATKGGIFMTYVEKGTKPVTDLRVQFKKPSVVIDRLSKTYLHTWYVDYERQLHFFSSTSRPAKFEITDSSGKWNDMSLNIDISQLKNRQVVRGGLAIAQSTTEQKFVSDGEQESWRFDYPPKDVRVFVDTTGGGTFTEKTVGIENLNDATQYDYVFNYSEKFLKRSQDAIIPVAGVLKMIYYPYKPIRIRVQDGASIAALKLLLGGDGIFDGSAITDTTIRSYEDARARGKAEIDVYKNAIYTITFKTDLEGLQAGDVLKITNAKRSLVSTELQIQRVSIQSKDTDRFLFTVQAGTTLFGLTEFFILLLKREGELIIDNEEVDIVLNIDETIGIDDEYTFTAQQQVWYVMGYTQNMTPRDGYSDFSEACAGNVDTSSNRVTTAT